MAQDVLLQMLDDAFLALQEEILLDRPMIASYLHGRVTALVSAAFLTDRIPAEAYSLLFDISREWRHFR